MIDVRIIDGIDMNESWDMPLSAAEVQFHQLRSRIRHSQIGLLRFQTYRPSRPLSKRRTSARSLRGLRSSLPLPCKKQKPRGEPPGSVLLECQGQYTLAKQCEKPNEDPPINQPCNRVLALRRLEYIVQQSVSGA